MRHASVLRSFASVILIAPLLVSAQRASAQYVLTYGQSVRSWGMGTIGAADDSDPANLFFNPAIIASSEGAFFTSGYWTHFASNDRYPLLYNVGAGLVGRRTLPAGRVVRFGGGIGYNKMDYGEVHYCRDLGTLPCPLARPKEASYSITGGAEVTFNSPLSAAVGLSVKPWRYNSGEGTVYEQTAYDGGLLLKATILDGEDAKLSTSIGAGFLNLGGKISANGHEYEQPKTFRYGLGLRYEGPTSGYFHDRFDVDLPICSVCVNYELIQDRTETKWERDRAWGVGTEVSILRILFLRTGFYKDDHGIERDGMLGFGLGWTFKRGWCRFDLASYPNYWEDRDKFLYGLSAGLTL